jgi:hypothetical protein
MKNVFISLMFSSFSAWAHVPALLPPILGTPMTSYFIGQSDISHAVYSELTQAGDFFVLNFEVKSANEDTKIEILVPFCANLPEYETFQPNALILKGDIPWKVQGESNVTFMERLKAVAVAQIGTSFKVGGRPKFYEEFSKQHYWVGEKWKERLVPGLYAIVVYDPAGRTGNFTVGLNEKEAWTPDLYAYAGVVVSKIQAGICSPQGFTGNLKLEVE